MSLLLLGVSNPTNTSVTFYILQETGDIILAENNDKLRQEDGTPSTLYAKWNSADKSANIALSNGDLTTTRSGGVGMVRATQSKNSGKWYWEVKIDSFTTACDVYVGIANATCTLAANLGSTVDGYGLALDDGTCLHNGFDHILTAFSTAVNDVIGIALDLSAGTLKYYKNNVLLEATTFSGITGTVYPALSVQFNAAQLTTNFGATTMTYTAPAGYNQGFYT